MIDSPEDSDNQNSYTTSQQVFLDNVNHGRLSPAGSGEFRYDVSHYLLVVKCGTDEQPQIRRRYCSPVFGEDKSQPPQYFKIDMDAGFNKVAQSDTYTVGIVEKIGEEDDQIERISFDHLYISPDYTIGPRVKFPLVASSFGNRLSVSVELEYYTNGELKGIYLNRDKSPLGGSYVSLHHLQELAKESSSEIDQELFSFDSRGKVIFGYDRKTSRVLMKTVEGDTTLESIKVPTNVDFEEVKEKLFPFKVFSHPYEASSQDDSTWTEVSLRKAAGIEDNPPLDVDE